MLRYKFASKKQRVLAFLIDAVIVVGIGALIGSLIFYYSGAYFSLLEKKNAFQEALQSDADATSFALEYLYGLLLRTGVYSGSCLLLVIIYLIVFPLCFEWQTLGRLVTKSRVLVCKTNERPDLKHLLMRDLVGVFLFYIVLTALLLYWNVVLILSMATAFMKGISIPDNLSHTKFVNKDPEEEFDDFMSMDEEMEMPLDSGDTEAVEVSALESEVTE